MGGANLDVLTAIDLRPPKITLDMNRVFFIDGVRRRTNIPHNGVVFTSDEYVEIRTNWTTPVATPLDRPEIQFRGRLVIDSIDFSTTAQPRSYTFCPPWT